MNIANQIALVTGANRGIGEKYVLELLDRGAAKVYATARRPELLTFDDSRVVPLHLDLLDDESVLAAAATASDVTLLVNNAGISTGALLVTGDLADVRREMDTHFWGTLGTIRAFAPVLKANGGGAIVNVLSALSWVSFPSVATYSASKSAAWSLTNGLRNELRAQGTQVVALHVGYMDTDMTRGLDAPKSSPADVARLTLEGVEAGAFEVLADDVSKQIKQSLSSATPAYAA